MQPIRIAIVDDQTLIREGLASLLALQPGLAVVGKAADGHAALDLVATQRPDVVLMDVRMPGLNGVAATRAITERFPGSRVLMLTTFDDDDYLFEALRAGAAGYLLKNADPDHLATAIRAVHAGGSVLDPAVTARVIARSTAAGDAPPALAERLTGRERDVLHQIAAGRSNGEIAARLSLSEGTVKNHVSHLLNKLAARDRAHLVRLAVEWGLLLEP